MTHTLQLDSSVYLIVAVEKASYRFIDRIAVVISKADENISLEITVDDKHAANEDKILADFKKELLDQNLRVKIKAETEPMRNLILAYTFSKTGLQS
jgi:His-Xaa-Ser system protein HxsD